MGASAPPDTVALGGSWVLGVTRLGQVPRSVALLSVTDSFVTPSLLGRLPGLFVVPVAFLIMSDKLLKFIQLLTGQ